MKAFIAMDGRLAGCVVGLLLVFGGLNSHATEPPARPRVPPWEIEPTEETKRKVEAEIEMGFDHDPFWQMMPVGVGESRAFQFYRDPLAVLVTDPTVVEVVWSARRQVDLTARHAGRVVELKVIYPGEHPGETIVVPYMVFTYFRSPMREAP